MDKSIKTEIVINASKEKVWDVLTQFEKYPDWNPFLKKIEGTLVKGGKLRNTMLNGKKNFVIKPIVHSVIPYKYFDWKGSVLVKGLFDGHHYFEIEEMSPQQVKLIHGEHFSGVLSTYILKKVSEDTRTNFVRMNEALKQVAEQ